MIVSPSSLGDISNLQHLDLQSNYLTVIVCIWASTRSATLWSWASIPWDCRVSTLSASEEHRLWRGVGGSSAEKRWRCAFAEEIGEGGGGGGVWRSAKASVIEVFFSGGHPGCPFLAGLPFFSLNFYFLKKDRSLPSPPSFFGLYPLLGLGSVFSFLLSFCLQL
jgi:hypothetical protein